MEEGVVEVLPLKGIPPASLTGNSAVSLAFLDECAEKWEHTKARLVAAKEARGTWVPMRGKVGEMAAA